MKRIAWAYILGVLFSGAVISLAAFNTSTGQIPSAWLFSILVVITTFTRVFSVISPDHQAYEGSTISLITSLLLLPLGHFIIIVIISHGIEWAWVRLRTPQNPHLRAWYIQPFNMAKCIVSGGVVFSSMRLLSVTYQDTFSPNYLLAIGLSIGLYVLISQLLLGMALMLARGISLRKSGIFRDMLMIELPLACVGLIAAELYKLNPLLMILALAPMALIYQAFMVPKLQAEAMIALENVNQDLKAANDSVTRTQPGIIPYVG